MGIGSDCDFDCKNDRRSGSVSGALTYCAQTPGFDFQHYINHNQCSACLPSQMSAISVLKWRQEDPKAILSYLVNLRLAQDP